MKSATIRTPRQKIWRILATAGMVLGLLIGTGTPEVSAAPACNPFPDVYASNVHCPNVEWLADQGITSPIGGLYKPDDVVNRGSMATFLYRLTNPGKRVPKCATKPFPDVETDYVHCGAIQWAVGNKITVGYNDGTYRPNNAVTRGAMATFIYRIANPGTAAPKCTSKPYPDVQQSYVHCGTIQWMKGTGITSGMPDGTYGKENPVNRASMASFLKRTDSTVDADWSRQDRPKTAPDPAPNPEPDVDTPPATEQPGGSDEGGSANVVEYEIDGELAYSISIQPYDVFYGPIGSLGYPVDSYLVFDIKFEAFDGINKSSAGYLTVNPLGFFVKDRAGFRYEQEIPYGIARTLGLEYLYAGEATRGVIVFDAPEVGSLVFDYPGLPKETWTFG